ncbi:biotin--[acetyl-CoA-carboxylase] ligase [Spirochaetota bacterium]
MLKNAKGELKYTMTSNDFIKEIQSKLKTDTFGQGYIFYSESIDSTNIKAKELANEGHQEGTVIIADSQSKGKGRKGRHWFSPGKTGIYMSLILKPPIIPSEAQKITLITAVAIAEVLKYYAGIDVRIKWPNDILVNNKKLAGILTEINTTKDSINYIIVGMGINVNTPLESMPSEIRDIATSILIETNKEMEKWDIVKVILESFERYYNKFLNNGFADILEEWKRLSQIMGSKIKVDLEKGSIEGEVVEVDKDGFLIIRDSDGNDEKIIAGDVSFIE